MKLTLAKRTVPHLDVHIRKNTSIEDGCAAQTSLWETIDFESVNMAFKFGQKMPTQPYSTLEW